VKEQLGKKEKSKIFSNFSLGMLEKEKENQHFR
jgi:hypothetical protein